MNLNNYLTKKITRKTYNSLVLIRSFFRKYHGLNKIDKKISKHIKIHSGFFIELGANDGISQSNTLYFERRLNWRGILIEPNPDLYKLCKKNRFKNVVINAACVSNKFQNKKITLFYQNLATKISQTENNFYNTVFHLPKDEFNYNFDVEAKTLTSIINEVGVTNIDFISIDVEGYELEVLKGLDFNKISIAYILIETNHYQKIAEYLFQFQFQLKEKISYHDYLFKHKNHLN